MADDGAIEMNRTTMRRWVLAAAMGMMAGAAGRADAAIIVDFEATPNGSFGSYSQGG